MFDFHIHTKYSGCCKEDYNVIDAYNKAEDRGYTGIGVSDHCNYKGYRAPGKFLIEQRKQISLNGLTDKVKLGLEITILNRKGDLGVKPKYLEKLDYYIISEHVHIAKLFSHFYRIKKKTKKRLKAGKKLDKIEKSIHEIATMVVNGAMRNPNTINAHLWRFPRNVNFLSTLVLEQTPRILEALQNSRVAFELHSGIVGMLMLTDEESDQLHEKNLKEIHPDFHELLLPPKEFGAELLKMMKKYDLKYALGSDAHRLNQVGRIGKNNHADSVKKYLASIGINEKELVTPEFFKVTLNS